MRITDDSYYTDPPELQNAFDKVSAKAAEYIEQTDPSDPAPTLNDWGSPFGSKTVEEMEKENRQMQHIREECSRRPIGYDGYGNIIYGNTPPPKSETIDEQKTPLPIITRGDLVPDKGIDFLWQDRIPYQFGLLAGRQNLGKSMFVAYLTAKITNASFKSWGDGAPCPTGCVMYFTPEGGAALTKRRICNMGGNAENIVFYSGLGSGRLRPDGTIDTDLDPVVSDTYSLTRAIDAAAKSTGQKVQLIIIDPIADFMGEVKQSNYAEVAKALRGLDYLAVERGVCILGVKHVTKSVNTTAAVYNVGDSVAYTSKPRFVYMLDQTPDSRKADLEKDDSIERRLVAVCAKHNDFDTPPSLELTLRNDDNDGKRVEITDFYSDWTAESLLHALSEINGGTSKGRGRPADDDRNAEVESLLKSMSPMDVVEEMARRGRPVGKSRVYEIQGKLNEIWAKSYSDLADVEGEAN